MHHVTHYSPRYNVQNGSELQLMGPLQQQSDIPKKCFSVTFEKGKENVMDYYTCRDCKFNVRSLSTIIYNCNSGYASHVLSNAILDIRWPYTFQITDRMLVC